jgi:tellurite resistance protein TerC
LQHAALWSGFAAIVAAALAFDLFVIGRRRRLGARKALAIYAAYVALALVFGGALAWKLGPGRGVDYFTAYLLETSLSLDNIFVWLLIFERLAVPEDGRHKALFWGVAGALAMRAGFILAGTTLLARFEWLLYALGGLVLASGVRMLRRGGEPPDPGKSRVLRLIRRHLPVNRFWTAVLLIETVDLAFALDSIPAIFGVSRDPLVVYSSNVFAVLGLRALYFAVAGAVERLRYLRYGLALLLGLIGLKMIASAFVELPVWLTLGATLLVLGGTVLASLLHRGATMSKSP